MVLTSEIKIMPREEFFATDMAKEIVEYEKRTISRSIEYRLSDGDYTRAAELRKKMSIVEDDVYNEYCESAKSLIEYLEKANAGDPRYQFIVAKCFMRKDFFFNPQESWNYMCLASKQQFSGAELYLDLMRHEFEGLGVDFSIEDNPPSAE